MNPLLLIAGTLFDVAGIVGILLTHFGVVPGFLVISPILFAIGIALWFTGAGLAHPVGVIAVFGFAAILLELIVYFNWLGLGGIL